MIKVTVEQHLVPVKHRLSRSRLAKLSKAISTSLSAPVTGEVDVSFVSDVDIQRLNRMYRGQDKITDVLSFQSHQPALSGQLGDVLIAYDQAVRQAADGDLELELVDLLIHGVLHLLGYDHEHPADAQVMFPLQDLIVAKSL